MKFVVTNIQGGAGSATATVVFQTQSTDPGVAQPTPPTAQPVSTLNLTVPMTSAGDYVVGSEYDITITKSAKAGS